MARSRRSRAARRTDGPGGPIRTATPSNVVVIPDDPRTKIPGSLLYVKDGNIWVQSGDRARQLTIGGQDAMPAWSPDGASIYFIRVKHETGKWPSSGIIRTYNLAVPSLLRLNADGSGQPEVLLTGRINRSSNTWSYFIREPSISPDGLTAAIVSDGPDPTRSDIVVKLVDLASGDAHRPEARGVAGARSPGPRLVAGWQGAPVRAQRPGGRARDAGDLPVHGRHGQVDRADRARLHGAGVVARTAGSWPRRRRAPSGRTS